MTQAGALVNGGVTPPPQRLAVSKRGWFLAVCGGVTAAAGVLNGGTPTLARALMGSLGLLILVLVSLSGRDVALTLVLVWLVLLGFIRRLIIPFAGWSPNDPLLLLSPAVAVMLWLVARADRPPPRTVLSSLALFFLLWVGAQLIHPNEDNLVVAAQASLFYVTPLLWFFVGRTLKEDQHDRVLATVFWMNVPVLALGLYHTFVGFLPFEYTWLGVSGQGPALFLPGFRIRPFSTFVSPQEYGYYLSFSAAVIWARLLYAHRHRGWLLLYFILTMVTLFLQASRSIFLFMLLSLVVTATARLRSPAVLLGCVVVVGGLVGLSARGEVAPPDQTESGPVAVLVQHQLSGLTNPSQSTAPVHIDLVFRGFAEGLRNPLGLGVSHHSIVRSKADPTTGPSSESDVPNAMATLGLPAGLALLAMIVVGLGAALRIQRYQPSARHLAWLGILVAAIHQWMAGSLYATSTILFLSLGGLARAVGDQTAGRGTSEELRQDQHAS